MSYPTTDVSQPQAPPDSYNCADLRAQTSNVLRHAEARCKFLTERAAEIDQELVALGMLMDGTKSALGNIDKSVNAKKGKR